MAFSLLQVLKHSATPHLKRFKISGMPNALSMTRLHEMSLPEVTSAIILSNDDMYISSKGVETWLRNRVLIEEG